jgi:hypothetical protein
MKQIDQFVLAAVCCLALCPAAMAGTAYDGAWILTVVTQRGSCDPTCEFTVDISNGVVTHPNLLKFRGHVASSGAARASVTAGEKYASGSGRLSNASRRGT